MKDIVLGIIGAATIIQKFLIYLDNVKNYYQNLLQLFSSRLGKDFLFYYKGQKLANSGSF